MAICTEKSAGGACAIGFRALNLPAKARAKPVRIQPPSNRECGRSGGLKRNEDVAIMGLALCFFCRGFRGLMGGQRFEEATGMY